MKKCWCWSQLAFHWCLWSCQPWACSERCCHCHAGFIKLLPKHLVNPNSLSFWATWSFPSDFFQPINVFKKTPKQTLDLEDKYVGKILKRFEVIWIIFAASVSLYFSIASSNEIWSVCLVCRNVWELPWYQCCVRFLVFQDKHQTE